jgi:hexosaminidase
VDAIPPESEAARSFGVTVDKYLAAPNAAAADPVRAQLAAWSKTAADVRPMLVSNSLLIENAPLADAIETLCRIGVEALKYGSEPAPNGWKQRGTDAVRDASKHNAALLIPFAPAIQKLVDSAR